MPEEIAVKYRQENITPFWRKLPFFFLFPFRFGPLVFLACIVAASALAGIALGTFSLMLKGFLVYLGLRYSFNVLELFAKGRFEGESVDHTLWGPEKRPAKLGLVLALFIVLGISLGNTVLASRIAKETRVQDQIIERYNKQHAAEIADRQRLQEAFNKRMDRMESMAAAARRMAADSGADAGDADEGDAGSAPHVPPELEAEADPAPDPGPTRAAILEGNFPHFSDPLWMKLQPAWYWMVMVLLSLLLPAAAIVIALEDKFFKALNPVNAVYLIQAMGSAYFALWAFFLAIAGTRQMVLTAGSSWPTVVSFPLEMAVATYLALVLFAIMGYALYQFHQELHLDVEVDFDDHRQAGGAEAIAKAGSARAALRDVGPQDPLERKVQALLAQDNVKEAIAEVRDHMRYDRFDAALNTRLHALYALQGDAAATLAHGQQWLTSLARAGDGTQALVALRALIGLDPAFRAEDGDVVLPAATAAYQAHDHLLAADLVRNFDKRFPQHKDTPAVFFLGARLLSEQMRQHDKAAKILRAVLAHFPDHSVAGEAKMYLSVLEGMLAKPVSAA